MNLAIFMWKKERERERKKAMHLEIIVRTTWKINSKFIAMSQAHVWQRSFDFDTKKTQSRVSFFLYHE